MPPEREKLFQRALYSGWAGVLGLCVGILSGSLWAADTLFDAPVPHSIQYYTGPVAVIAFIIGVSGLTIAYTSTKTAHERDLL
jgi:nitrate reductase gamma subunit